MSMQSCSRMSESGITKGKVFIKANFDVSNIDVKLNSIAEKSPNLEIIILKMKKNNKMGILMVNCIKNMLGIEEKKSKFQLLRNEENIGVFIESCIKNIPKIKEIHIKISFKLSSWIDRLSKSVRIRKAKISATDGMVSYAVFDIKAPKKTRMVLKQPNIIAEWMMIKNSQNYPNRLLNIKSIVKIELKVENNNLIVESREGQDYKRCGGVLLTIQKSLLLEDMDELKLDLWIRKNTDAVDIMYSFFDTHDNKINYSCTKLLISSTKTNFPLMGVIIKKLSSLLPNLTKLTLSVSGGKLKPRLELSALFPRLSVIKIKCWGFSDFKKVCKNKFDLDLHLSVNISPDGRSLSFSSKYNYPLALSVLKLNSYLEMTPPEAKKIVATFFDINHSLNKISVRLRVGFLNSVEVRDFFEWTSLFLLKKAKSVKLFINEIHITPECVLSIISPGIVHSLEQSDTLCRLDAVYYNKNIPEKKIISFSSLDICWSKIRHNNLSMYAKRTVLYILCCFKYVIGCDTKTYKHDPSHETLINIKLSQFPNAAKKECLLPPPTQFFGNVDVQKISLFLFHLKFLKVRVPRVIKLLIVREFLLVLDNRAILNNFLKAFPSLNNNHNFRKRKRDSNN